MEHSDDLLFFNRYLNFLKRFLKMFCRISACFIIFSRLLENVVGARDINNIKVPEILLEDLV